MQEVWEKLRSRIVALLVYVRWLCSMITVEPAVFFFAAAMDVMSIVRTNGFYWKICEQSFGGIAGVRCNDKTHGMTAAMRNSVQEEVADLTLYISLSQVIPVAIVAPLYGAFADRNGRKSVILITTIGLILMNLVFIAEMTWVHLLPTWLFIVAGFVTTFTGFYGTFMSACFAYVSDREPNRDRLTVRFSVIQVASSLSSTIIGFSISKFIGNLTYSHSPLLSICLILLLFFYSLIFLREVPPKLLETNQLKSAEKPKNEEPLVKPVQPRPKPAKTHNPLALWSLTKESVRTALKPREGHYRTYIWLLLVAFFFVILTTQAEGQILHLFMLDEPLNWSIGEQAVYNGFTSLVRLIGTLVATGVLKLLGFHETSILLIAFASTILRLVLVGAAQTTATMYVAAVLGLVGFLAMFVSKSLVSQLVPNDEVGKVYALFQLVSDVAHLAGEVSLNKIYVATRRIYPGLVFHIMAVTKVVAFLIVLWIHIDYRRYRRAKVAKAAEIVSGGDTIELSAAGPCVEIATKEGECS